MTLRRRLAPLEQNICPQKYLDHKSRTEMKNLRTLTAALVALAFVGCSTTLVWYQPNKTFEETRRDLALCRADAARLMSPVVIANPPPSYPQPPYNPNYSSSPQYSNPAVADNAAAAAQSRQGLSTLGAFLAADANQKNYVNNCMVAKGYSLVDKNSLPPGVAGVPK
jgi:hypothetical protein